jgi:hypothetical protein
MTLMGTNILALGFGEYYHLLVLKALSLLHKSFPRRIFFYYRGGHCNRLYPRVTVNRGLMEVVALPASVNQLTEVGV